MFPTFSNKKHRSETKKNYKVLLKISDKEHELTEEEYNDYAQRFAKYKDKFSVKSFNAIISVLKNINFFK